VISQNFIPMLSYEEGLAAIAWLKAVFDCDEGTQIVGDDGRLAHGELVLDGQKIMLATPSPHYQSPKTVRRNYTAAAELAKSVPYIIDGVLVYVPSVREVFDRAKANGAAILSEIDEGGPGARFRMEDPEGHRWYVIERS
jgi:uncharacterized glyoxalase superfamily protein PhnB